MDVWSDEEPNEIRMSQSCYMNKHPTHEFQTLTNLYRQKHKS